MNADEEPPCKKKIEKQSPDNITVTVDKIDSKRLEKGEEDPKPRIVLTFRSEKSNAKNSNMKIVSSEEKHEDAPRRSSRTRGKWEWICDSDTSPKKDKSGAQTTSENDESDSSHTTPKRSTRRRSKDSDNVLANAIARKEKSYETQAAPQRLSRRIKPTAKILANEELRIGLESQNNARLGIQNDKSPEEGVRTRRSARPAVAEKKVPVITEDEVVEIATTDDDSQSQNTVMKLKHLCELGLKARSPEEADDSGNENREVEEIDEDVENEAEEIDEDDEIDDDPNVISKLLETDEDSDEDFQCSIDVKKNRPRTRRSTRLTSSYGMNDSDRSSPAQVEDLKPRRSIKRAAKPKPGQLFDYGMQNYIRRMINERPKRRRTRIEEDESYSEEQSEEISQPADGDEGSEAACPGDKSTIIATCYCNTPSNVYAAPEELTEPVFCQAIEVVEGVRVGCSHRARRTREGVAALVRAGPRAPYSLVCALHAAQLQEHMCCPACGLFCSQGTFYQCSSGHLFHIECGLPYNDVKVGRPGCPHCGVYSYRWQPVNTQCYKVKLEMKCSNKRIFLPDQREQCTPAYLGFSAQSLRTEQGPIIPKDLLPSPPIELKQLSQASAKSPAKLCEAILKGEPVDQLLTLLVSSSHINKPLGSQSGGRCVHVAARSGHVGALYLLHYAGANIDATDSNMRTPLMVAIAALLHKPDRKGKEKLKAPSEKDNDVMDVTPDKDATNPEQAPVEIKTEKQDNVIEINVKVETEEDMEPPTENKEVVEEQKDVAIEKDNDTVEETEVLSKDKEEDLIRVIRYLLAAGCDINFQGPDGMTALHMCAQLGGPCAVRVVSLLLSHTSTELDRTDHGGWTPLVWAAENDHADIVKLLVEGGGNVLSTDLEGNGVVHWCALSGAGAALRVLLHHAPHAALHTNAHGDTPLHIAARQGHYACVVILLARGARTDIENSAGELPVEVCASERDCQSAISLNMQMNIAVRDKLSRFKLLSNDISNGREPFPIPCVNEVDDATLPEDFTYVTQHVTPQHINVDNTIDTLQGCECREGECSSGECACCALGVRCWYSRGRLLDNFPYHDPPMLFECNQTCRCNLRRCNNSVVSKASAAGSVCVRAQVFRAGGARGWGLRAAQALRRGALVALYCGELLALHAADTRPKDHYMFALDVKHDLLEQCEDKSELCVDAAQFGGAARFINHSCRPNLAPVRVFTRTRDLRLPTVALFATTDIHVDDEFTFDYGDKFWSVKSKWMKCECGHVDCRYPVRSNDDAESS